MYTVEQGDRRWKPLIPARLSVNVCYMNDLPVSVIIAGIPI